MLKKSCFLIALAIFFPVIVYAQTNTTLQYQGSLFDSQGAPVTTNKTITFRLFSDAETGESSDALWTETLAVDIADGFFTVPLGSVNAFDESVFKETELWLELEIDSETLSPRQPVAAVPWARRAFSVEGKVEATSITSEGSVTVGGSEVINASGQWVGSTQTATDLNCSGCVDTSEVSFNVCIADESGNAAYADEAGTASALDCTGCVAASQLADDYTTAAEVEAMIGDLPADGLSEVSNGILDNVLSQTHHATDVPKTITDHFPAGINSTIAIPTTGTIRSVSVTVDITHTDIGELQIKLFPPVGGVITLHDQGQTGTSDLSTMYPTETVPAAGSFDNLTGMSPNGNWTLQIIDDVENLEGILNTWAVNIEYISDIDITLDGNLNVTGNLDVTGQLSSENVPYVLSDNKYIQLARFSKYAHSLVIGNEFPAPRDSPKGMYYNNFSENTCGSQAGLKYKNGQYSRGTPGSFCLETNLFSKGIVDNKGFFGFDYEVWKVIDEFEDGVVDEEKWTGEGIEENDSGLRGGGGDYVTSTSLAFNGAIKIGWSLSGTYYSVQSQNGYMLFTDGSSSYNVISAGGAQYQNNDIISGETTIYVNWDQKTVFYSNTFINKKGSAVNQTRTQQKLNLSAWNDFKVKFYTSEDGGSFTIHYARSLLTDPQHSEIDILASNDGGQIWENTQNYSEHIFQNSGDTLKGKICGTVYENEVVTIQSTYIISE